MSTFELISTSDTFVAHATAYDVRPTSAWFAYYVKHRHEKSIALHLERVGVENFLPLYRKARHGGKHSELPLFPGYIFCRPQPHELLRVASTPGVHSVVEFGNAPARIPDQEIEAVKRLLSVNGRMQPWNYIAPGQQVRLKSGPFRDVEAVVVNANHETWVVLSVHILQRSVAVKMERSALAV